MMKEYEIREAMRRLGFNRAAEECDLDRVNLDYIAGCWRLRERMGRPIWSQIFGGKE